jgi:hypothetical protein
MVLAIPGGKGLFSILQEVLRNKCDHGTRVHISQPVHRVFQDFIWLAEDITRRPKRTAEITPKAKPDTLGAQDTSAMGMGGIHFVRNKDGTAQPLLWMIPFPGDTQARLVSFDNPAGDINNSELKLAASVTQHGILAEQLDIREATIHNSSENVATVWWQRK